MIGQKHDEDKLPIYTVLAFQFPNAINEVVKCSNAGHKKYPNDIDWQNFKRVDLENNPHRYLNAALRHIFDKDIINEDMVEYGEILHLAQAAWNILAHLEITLSKK